jgi:putative tricarboxylic transport membrane protein
VRTADIVCGVILAAVAVVVVFQGRGLGIGWSTDGPQPGFFVFYLGVALLVSAVMIVVRAVRRHKGGATFAGRDQVQSVATVLLPAVAMVVLTHVIGLYVSGALYLAVYMRWIGRHRWVTTVVIALAIPLTAFLIFEIWFLVPLPKGPLEARLGY